MTIKSANIYIYLFVSCYFLLTGVVGTNREQAGGREETTCVFKMVAIVAGAIGYVYFYDPFLYLNTGR